MHPIACGLFLLFAALVAFLGWLASRTVRSLHENGAGAAWWIVFGLSLLAGFIGGLWCACCGEYQSSEDKRYVGMPVPGMILVHEDGRWVDYISPVMPFTFFLDLLMVFFASTLPVSIAYAVGCKWKARSGRTARVVAPGHGSRLMQ